MIRNAILMIITLMLFTTMFSGCLENSEDNKPEVPEPYFPPVVTITSPERNDQVNGSVDILISMKPVKPVVQIDFYIDDVLIHSSFEQSYTWDTTMEENGKHLIEVTALEIGPDVPPGTTAMKTSTKLYVYNEPIVSVENNIPPSVTIITPTGDEDGVYRGPVTIRGEVEDPETELDFIEFRTDGDGWIEVPVSKNRWQHTIHPVSYSGEVNVEARAYDGKNFSEIQQLTITLDNTPPALDITNPSDSETISGTYELRAVATDDHGISYITFSLDIWELQNSTENKYDLDTSEFEEGDHTLIVEVADSLGNYHSEETEFSILNNEAPVTVISSPEDGSQYYEEDIIHFDASESYDPDGGEIRFIWESNIEGVLSEEEIFDTTLSTGQHTITLTVTDDQEEIGEVQIQISVTTPQNQPPEIEITSPEDGSTLKGTITVEGTAHDHEEALENLDYRIDEGEWNSISISEDWSFSLDTTEFEDGDHEIELRAKDNEGKTSLDTIGIRIVNDGLVVEITDPMNGSYVSKTIDISSEVDDEYPIEYISFVINGEEIQNSTSTSCEWNTENMDDGTTNITVNARDSEGRSGTDSIQVIIDNTLPEVIIVSHESDDLVKGSVMIVGESMDTSPTPHVSFLIDDATVSESGSLSYSWDTSGYEDGDHTIELMVEDAAGNVNSTILTLVVDNTRPTIEITSPEDGSTTTEDSVTVLVDALDMNGIQYVEYLVDSVKKGQDSNSPYALEIDLTGYEDGDHTILVIALDEAGNNNQDSITITLSTGEASVISHPGPYELTPYSTSGKTRLVLKEENFAGVPVASSLLRNRGITASIEWSKSPVDELNIAETDSSIFSSRLSLSYWSKPEQAIVVETYEDALLSVPLASYLDLPVLIYGSTTDEALWRLETIYANQIITVGDTPYNDHEGVTVLNKDTLLDHTLGVASALGISIDYLVVAFPGDDGNMALDHSDNRDNYVERMSTFSAQFAAYHNGIILTCEGNSVDARRIYLNETIRQWRIDIESKGHTINYLLMAGDYYSLPMITFPFTVTTVNGGTQTKNIPSDNWYLNKVGNPYQVEISGGRLVAKSLANMSYYVDRIVNYESYLEGNTEPAVAEWTIYQPTYPIYKPWSNNALIYQGNGAEFAADSENAVRNMLHDDGHFHTLDDSGLAKECTNSGDARNVLMDDFANSNFIAIDADHGEPHQCTLTFASDDLKDMKPGVMFGVSCMLGQIDDTNHLPSGDDSESYNVHASDSMTFTLLEKGVNAFIGSTRTALGSFGATTFVGMVDYSPYQAPGLCYLFFDNLINQGMTTGDALMNAKIDLYSLNSDEGNRYSIWEYVHYGDPAFDPYVPSIDG